jgi:type II secretory pathway component PulF
VKAKVWLEVEQTKAFPELAIEMVEVGESNGSTAQS